MGAEDFPRETEPEAGAAGAAPVASNNRIYWRPIAGGTGNYGAIQYSATSLMQGAGSSIAYAKSGTNNRIFVVNKNGTVTGTNIISGGTEGVVRMAPPA